MSSINTATQVFEDFKINVKLKISALWIAVMFCYVYGDYIQIYVPGMMAQAMTVEATPEIQWKFFAIAILMALPSLMIFISLVAKPKLNRCINIIVSLFFIIILIATNINETWWFYLLLTILEVLISTLILWYAWKWPTIKNL